MFNAESIKKLSLPQDGTAIWLAGERRDLGRRCGESPKQEVLFSVKGNNNLL